MKFKFSSYHPCCALQPFVNGYVSMNGNHRDAWQQNLVPSNMQNLGFIFNGSIRSSLDPDCSVTRSFVVGQIEKPLTVDFKEDLEVITVFFKPTGMYRLFGIPMQLFTDRCIDFESVCDRQDKYAVQKIFDGRTTEQRVAAIEVLLLGRLSGAAAQYLERIEYASHLILDRSGNIPVNLLAREVNMSKRNLERHFIEQVGVSPKSFSGIVRIKKVLELIEMHPHCSWKDISQTLEFTDHAHFFHEFKKFTGRTPNEYFRSITNFEHFLYAG